jgi:hypothetical protein
MSTKEPHFLSKATRRYSRASRSMQVPNGDDDAARSAGPTHAGGFSDSQPLHHDTSQPSSSRNDCTHASDGSLCFRLLDTAERHHQFG